MNIEQVYNKVNSQLDKDTFDNCIILTLTEWNCIKLRIKALETTNDLLHDENQELILDNGDLQMQVDELSERLCQLEN